MKNEPPGDVLWQHVIFRPGSDMPDSRPHLNDTLPPLPNYSLNGRLLMERDALAQQALALTQQVVDLQQQVLDLPDFCPPHFGHTCPKYARC